MMVHKVFWTAFITILFLLSADVQADKTKKELVEELYIISGLENSVNQLPSALKSGIEQMFSNDPNIKKLPEDFKIIVNNTFPQFAKPGFFKQEILKTIESRMNEADIIECLEWMKSPLGTKITRIEISRQNPSEQDMKDLIWKIKHNLLPDSRMKLIQKLVSATKSVEFITNMSISTQLAVVTAGQMSLPAGRQKTFTQLKQEAEKNKYEIENSMKSFVLINYLYTYSPLTDSEIIEFTDFVLSEPGQNYYKTSHDSITGVMVKIGMELGKAIAADLKNGKNGKNNKTVKTDTQKNAPVYKPQPVYDPVTAQIKELYRQAKGLRSKNPQRSIEVCNQALEIDPKNAKIYNERGYAYINIGNHSQACKDFHEAEKYGDPFGIKWAKYNGYCSQSQ